MSTGLGADQLVILAVGAMVAVSCSLIGCFLVLRKVAMLGDAISHAVLPGIALVFLLGGGRNPIHMLLGACLFGVLTVFLVGQLNRTRRLHEDASIGVVFPALFSVGVILISRYARHVDLDLDCVLFGDIAYTPIDLLLVGEVSIGPKALWVNGPILVLDALLVVLCFKELKVTSFDPDLAAALGISPLFFHYLLMSAVSLTVVGAFESVGAILVVAMLIVPPATAYLLTDRLWVMLLLASALGVASSTLGYFVASALDCSIAGAMAATAGLFFVLALLLSPGQGLVARGVARLRLAGRLRDKIILLHLRNDAGGVSVAELEQRFAWSRARVRRALGRLERQGWVEGVDRAHLRLTEVGAQAIAAAGAEPLVHATDAGE